MSFLSAILDHKRAEVQRCRESVPIEAMPPPALSARDFAAAIGKPGVSVIAEIKRKSPSRGFIAEDGITRFYRRYFNLEGLLGLAGILLLIGIGLDGLIFFRWVSGNEMGISTMGTAALAQSAIIIGANLALGAFLVALIDLD